MDDLVECVRICLRWAEINDFQVYCIYVKKVYNHDNKLFISFYFSKMQDTPKLVSRCTYVNILKATKDETVLTK